jgi:hypothetical protein
MDLTDECKNQAEPPVPLQAGGLRDPAYSAGNDDADGRPEITRRRRTIFGRTDERRTNDGRTNDGRTTAERRPNDGRDR